MAEFKNISIRNKLIIIQLATAFFAVLFCCSVFVFNNIKVFKNASITSENAIAEIIGINAASTLEFMDHDAAKDMLMKLKNSPSVLNAVILDKNGKEFARYDKFAETAFLFPVPGSYEAKKQGFFDPRFLVSYRIAGKEFLGTVMLRAEIAGFKAIVLNYLKIAFIILLASLLAAFIISTILQRSITSRLLSLVHKTKEVADTGDYSVRVPAEGQDEMGVLSGAFNNMLSQIETQNHEIVSFNQNLENKVTERTQQLQEANKELEAFSYTVSHDLRAPLRAISGFTTLYEEEYENLMDERGKKLLGVVKNNANKMGILIDDLLAFARLGRQEISKSLIDMETLCRNVLFDLNKSMDHHANVKIGPLLPVRADSSLMEHVISNLLSNAIKYSSKKDNPVVEIKCERKNGELIYSVSDNGAGFDMAYANKLFGVFQRLHTAEEFKGTGVGLAIVQRIINKHNGHIWAEAKVDEGATFYFSLPEN